MFVLQMFLAFQDLVFVADNMDILTGVLEISGFSWRHWRHSSEWLAGVKASRRREGGELYLDAGCYSAVDDKWGDDDKRPMCSGWYLFVIGELLLTEELMVHTLAQLLLALSGSVVLLLIR